VNKDLLIQKIKDNGKFNATNGSINVSALAKAAGIHQPTLKRILDGSSKHPKPPTIQKICRVIGIDSLIITGLTVSPDLAQGEIPSTNLVQGEILSTKEKQLIATFRSLSTKNKALATRLLGVLE
jgi:hypothetical protein